MNIVEKMAGTARAFLTLKRARRPHQVWAYFFILQGKSPTGISFVGDRQSKLKFVPRQSLKRRNRRLNEIQSPNMRAKGHVLPAHDCWVVG